MEFLEAQRHGVRQRGIDAGEEGIAALEREVVQSGQGTIDVAFLDDAAIDQDLAQAVVVGRRFGGRRRQLIGRGEAGIPQRITQSLGRGILHGTPPRRAVFRAPLSLHRR